MIARTARRRNSQNLSFGWGEQFLSPEPALGAGMARQLFS